MTQKYISAEARHLASLVYPEKEPNPINYDRELTAVYSSIFCDRDILYREDIQKLLENPTFYSISIDVDHCNFDVTLQRMETDEEYAARIGHKQKCFDVYNKRRDKWQNDIAAGIEIAEERAKAVTTKNSSDPEYQEFLRLMKKFVHDAT